MIPVSAVSNSEEKNSLPGKKNLNFSLAKPSLIH